MRAVGKAAGVQGHHAGFNIVAAEEVATVVEQHFVVVVVVVIERHLQRARVTFHRARGKGADHKTISHKGGVRRRRQVVAVAHHRANVAPVQAHHGVIAMPADHIQRVVWVGHGADLVAPFDADLPGVFVLLRFECIVQVRMVEHRRVEDGMRAKQAFVRQLIGAVGVFDQQHKGRLSRLNAPRRTTRNHQVIAIAVFQVAEVAIEMPAAFMHKQQLIAVAIAHQVAHGAVALPYANSHIAVVQRQRRGQRAIACARYAVEVKGMRAQRALPVHPAGGRVFVVQVRGGAEKPFAAHFPLISAFGKIAVRLA